MKMKSRANSGFSLIEISLAIGVVAFAFVAILGLLPTGMNTFRKAVDTSVSTQIVQRVLNEAMQTDFDEMINNLERAKQGEVVAHEFRYFDDQGGEVDAEDIKSSIYTVSTLVKPYTDLPSTSSSRIAPKSLNLATVMINVVANPLGVQVKVQGDKLSLPKGTAIIASHSALIARNQRTPKN